MTAETLHSTPNAPTRPAQPARTRVPAKAWITPILIVVLAMINFADKSVLGLSAVPLSKELGLSNGTYGLVASSFFLLFSLSALLVGFIANRVQVRWLLIVMAIVWSLAQIPVVAAASLTTLFVSRIILGAAEGPTASVAIHGIFKWFPPSRRALPGTLYTAGAGLGVFIAAPILTWIITHHGWRSAFATLAVVGAVWCVVWLAIGREGSSPTDPDVPGEPMALDAVPAGAGHTTAAGTSGPATTDSTASGDAAIGHAVSGDAAPVADDSWRVPYRRLFGSRTWLASAVNGLGAYWSIAVGGAFVPAYLITTRGFTPGHAADAVSLYALVAMLVPMGISLVAGRYFIRGRSSKWTRGFSQWITVLVAAVAMLILPHVHGGAGSYVLIAFAFGLSAVAAPLSYLTTAEVTPLSQRGASLGTSIAVQTLPGLFAPAVTGWLIDSGNTVTDGYTLAFTVGGVVMAVCGVFGALMMRPDKDAAKLRALRAPTRADASVRTAV